MPEKLREKPNTTLIGIKEKKYAKSTGQQGQDGTSRGEV